MKAFIKSIILFFVPLFLVVIGLEVTLRQLPNSYKLKTEFLEYEADTIETLILGSSHTFYGVNPLYFTTKAFNMSNVSQSPDMDWAILQSYEAQLTHLKTVVIRLSYDTLFEQLKFSSEDWRLKDYNLYTNVGFNYTLAHNSEVLALGLNQSLRVLQNTYSDKTPLLNCDSLGFGNVLTNAKPKDLNRVGPIAAKRHTITSWHLLDKNIEVFNALITFCEKRNIRVLLITPPAYKSYRDNLNMKQLNKMIETGQYLDKTYKNCSYYNFMTHPNFLITDFYDADHLNAVGAKKFSLILNGLIEN